MDRKTFETNILGKLQEENISVLEAFDAFQKVDMDHFAKIEWTHEFLDLLTFKLKESKCKLDKNRLAEYLFRVFKETVKTYDYNTKFIAAQLKSLIIFYRNQKDFDKAIETLEFLISCGITDDEGLGFHVQLDEFYRLRQKRDKKKKKNSE